jgi:hypothetical protein
MSDDSDDPVMALLATQRAVLAAVENLAGQVEAMQGKVDAMGETLVQLVAGSAGASGTGVLTLGDRFRQATDKEAAADPELRAAQGNYMVAQAIAKGLNKGDPDGSAREIARVREWIADQLDRGRVFEPAKVRDGDKGAVAVVEPIHEEMFTGRVKVARQLGRER